MGVDSKFARFHATTRTIKNADRSDTRKTRSTRLYGNSDSEIHVDQIESLLVQTSRYVIDVIALCIVFFGFSIGPLTNSFLLSRAIYSWFLTPGIALL